MACLFTFLVMYFDEQKFLILISPSLSVLLILCLVFFVSYYKIFACKVMTTLS